MNLPFWSNMVIPRSSSTFLAILDGEVSDASIPRRLVPACSPMMPFFANRASAPAVSSIETPKLDAGTPAYFSAFARSDTSP